MDDFRIARPTARQKLAKWIFWLIILALAGFSGLLDFEGLAAPEWKPIPSWVGILSIAILLGGRWLLGKINWSFLGAKRA
ncbi:MAG: hypothetical protein ACOYS2_01390 [Patescibacteria group bacterium]